MCENAKAFYWQPYHNVHCFALSIYYHPNYIHIWSGEFGEIGLRAGRAAYGKAFHGVRGNLYGGDSESLCVPFASRFFATI